MKRIIPISFPASPEVLSAKDIGIAIKALRTKSGNSIEEAALICGISPTTYNGIELGRGAHIDIVLSVAQSMGLCVFVAPREVRQLVDRALKDAIHAT